MPKPPPPPIQPQPRDGWHRGELCAGDTETDSPDPLDARVITATMVRTADGRPWHKVWVARPERPIPDGAAAVHGYPTERAEAEGAGRAEVLAEMHEWLMTRWTPERPLVIMNAPFDLTVWDREFRRVLGHGLTIRGPVFDPMVVDRELDKYRAGGRKLVDVCRHYSIPLSEKDAHSSLADTYAAGRVAQALGDTFALVRKVGPKRLHELQTKWKAEQSAGLLAYWRKNPHLHPEWRDTGETPDRDVVDSWHVPTEWPMIPFHESELEAQPA